MSEEEAELRRILERAAERARPVPPDGLREALTSTYSSDGEVWRLVAMERDGGIVATGIPEGLLNAIVKHTALVCGAEVPDPCAECGDGLLDVPRLARAIEEMPPHTLGYDDADALAKALADEYEALPPDVVPHG